MCVLEILNAKLKPQIRYKLITVNSFQYKSGIIFYTQLPRFTNFKNMRLVSRLVYT